MPLHRNPRTQARQNAAQQIRAVALPIGLGLAGAADETQQVTITVSQTRCDGDSVSGDVTFLGLLDITPFGEPFRLA